MTTVSAESAARWIEARAREPRLAWEELISGAPYLQLPASSAVPGAEHMGSAVALLDGVVRGYTTAAAARQLTMRYGRPGDIVGLTTALGGTDEFYMESVTPVALAVLSPARLHELAIRHPELGWALAQALATASTSTMRLLSAKQTGSTVSQVAVHLLEWSEASEGHAVARVSHQQLAEATGTAREVVTRALAGLRDAGVVETRRGVVVVLDTNTLERVARGDSSLEASDTPLSAR